MVITKQKTTIDTQKKKKKEKRYPNTTLKLVIKLQGKRAKEEERNKKNYTNNPKQLTNCKNYTAINNYFKCKWTKYSKQGQRVAEWIQKQDPYIRTLHETHFRSKDTD